MKQSRDNIEQRLRPEKPMFKAPDDFTERVMSRLPSERKAAAPERFALLPRLAFCFAVLAAAAFFASDFSRPTSGPLIASSHSPEPVASSDPQKPELAAVDLSIPVITSEQIQALTVKLDDPLQKELNNVISDTRQAIQFVASNFLPEK